MIELSGNFNQDAFNYAEKFLTIQNQVQTHKFLFPVQTMVDFSGLPENIRTFNQLDKQFKERYFSQYPQFSLIELEENPSLRKVYYFPFEVITLINCNYIITMF